MKLLTTRILLANHMLPHAQHGLTRALGRANGPKLQSKASAQCPAQRKYSTVIGRTESQPRHQPASQGLMRVPKGPRHCRDRRALVHQNLLTQMHCKAPRSGTGARPSRDPKVLRSLCLLGCLQTNVQCSPSKPLAKWHNDIMSRPR
jgi:hypothetical protein